MYRHFSVGPIAECRSVTARKNGSAHLVGGCAVLGLHLIRCIYNIAPHKAHVNPKNGQNDKIKQNQYFAQKKEEIIMEIYEALKEARETKGISQQDIANRMQTTRQQISKYECGIQDITAKRLREICLYYGVSADYILGLPPGLEWPK